MTLRQLRALQEVVKQGLRISAAAEALHTSQPGVSRQILELEQELGVSIFVRKRGRLVSVTEAGVALLGVAGRMLDDAASLRTIASEYSSKDTGQLSIATTHTHACYTLPRVIQQFSAAYPRVQLSLREGTPAQCCEIVATAGADLAIVTQTAEAFESLATLPAYRLPRCLVLPVRHPLLGDEKLTLEKIARYPLITYDSTFSSRRSVDRAFAARRLTPDIVLRAIDADVSKKYVALGLGVAILPAIAYDPKVDTALRALDVDHLFEQGLVNVCLRKGSYVREFIYAFITMFAPHLTRRVVSRSLRSLEPALSSAHDVPVADFSGKPKARRAATRTKR
ncbi:MAG TPA: LysR substrate-binding domain-containing protein [Burkholderiales bacterium]|nr:LysR substrate-binding domain-containing protein [Burkholderiales bacterium]